MKQTEFFLKKTADGSDTLFSPEMNETYHSVNGAIQESRHVFIEAGMHRCKQQELRILEIGFGTGLNALLTWKEAFETQQRIIYETLEAFPLSENLISALNYGDLIPDFPTEAFKQLHQCPWNTSVELDQQHFILHKRQVDFTTDECPGTFDLIYFDAFAPEKQPEMWEESLFQKLFERLNATGILVTYCAKGEVRRRMQRAGFRVERIPGPLGKREMLRANK